VPAPIARSWRQNRRRAAAEDDVAFAVPGDHIGEDPIEDLGVDDENLEAPGQHR